MPDQYTLEGFGQKIKAKYPQYKDVPDAELAQKVLAKYPQYEGSIAKSGPAPKKPEDLTVGNFAGEIARGVGRGIRNDVMGAVDVARQGNIFKTIDDQLDQASDAWDAGKKEFKDTAGAPLGQRLGAAALTGLENAPMIGGMVQHAEEGGEQIGSPEGYGALAEGLTTFAAPEAAAKVIKLAPRLAEGGTRATKELVKDTREENAGIADKNAKQVAARAAEVKEHGEAASAAKKAADARSALATRKSALETGVKKLSDKFQEDLKKTRDEAHAKADAKYNSVKEALGGETIPSNVMVGHLLNAAEKIEGSMNNPAIFKDIEKAVTSGDTISYRDLQGYYSELGTDLAKGGMKGDIYTAYSTLQDAIGEEMQKVANRKGLGPQLTDARVSWRNLKQTFYDPKSPLRKALTAPEAGDAIGELAGKDRTGIQALARYNPDLARRANTIRGYADEAAAIRVPGESTKATPALGPRKAPIPEKKIGAEDIREAKGASLEKKADRIRSLGDYGAVWPAFYSLRTLIHGGVPNLLEAGAEATAIPALGHGIANILEKPAVKDFLTRATARDVAQIPLDLRGDMSAVVKAAQKKGIKVSPLLVRSVQGTAFLAPRKEQNATDSWAAQQ